MTLQVEPLWSRPVPAAEAAHEESGAATGLHFDVARSIEDVIDAWGLVYIAYRRIGLIDPNPYELHTTPQAVGPQTAVMIARLGPVATGTLSAILDNPGGLPLDSVYARELNDLRSQDRKLMELGLFADRREDLARSFGAILEMMRLATYYGRHSGATDAVIGVHPRHARFYKRYLSFDVAGPETTYSTVNDRPVVLLRLDWNAKLKLSPMPPGVEYIAKNPLPPEAFAHRYQFDRSELEKWGVWEFVHGKPTGTSA